MSDDKPSTHDVMAKLLAQKKAAGPKTPEHTEFVGKNTAAKGSQIKLKPSRPGGNRGRG